MAKARTRKTAVEAKEPVVEAKPVPHAANPEQEGYYWLYDHRRDSVYLMLFQGGIWHDVLYEGMGMKEIIGGPLPYPTEEQIDGHQAHFEAFRAEEWAKIGFDPVWEMVERELPTDPGVVPQSVDPMMDGWFWIQFCDQELPEIAHAREGTFYAMEINGPTWEHSDPNHVPAILFGPLILPDMESVASRNPELAALARARIVGRIQ